MPWETRGNGLYYYRSVRQGTRVVKEYVGSGVAGVLAERHDAEQRKQREREAARWQRERERWDALDRSARELDDLAELLVGAALTLAGYHRHDRGGWRRRRD